MSIAPFGSFRRVLFASLLIIGGCHATDRVPASRVETTFYPNEFWRRDSGAAGVFDRGDIVERVSHAFTLADDGMARTTSKTYRVQIDAREVQFASRVTTTAQPLIFHSGVDANSIPRGASDGWGLRGNIAERLMSSALDVVEHLEARASGVELTWILNSPPTHGGDVTFEVTVTSQHHAIADGAAAMFQDSSGQTLYRISKGVAVDMAGKRVEVAAQVTPTGVSFTLPADLLATSSYPLALDPVVDIAFGPLQSSGVVAQHTNTASVATLPSGQSLVVWADDENVGDIWATRISAEGAILDSPAILLHDSVIAQAGADVRVAALNGDYVVAWKTVLDGLEVVRVNDAGTILDSEPLIVATVINMDVPFAVACGSERCGALYNAVNQSGQYELRYALFDFDGQVDAPALLDTSPSSIDADLGASQSTFAAAWTPTTSAAALSIATFADTVGGSAVSVSHFEPSAGTYYRPQLGFDGSDFAVAVLHDTSPASAPNSAIVPTLIIRDIAGLSTVGPYDVSGLPTVYQLAVAGKNGNWVLAYTESQDWVYASAVTHHAPASTFTASTPVRLSTEVQRLTKLDIKAGAGASAAGWIVAWSASIVDSTNVNQQWFGASRARLISMSGGALTPSTNVLKVATFGGYMPWIQVAQNAGEYLFVWQQTGDDDYLLRGAIVDYTGYLVTPYGLQLFQGAVGYAGYPTVAADGAGFLVVALDSTSVGTRPFSQVVSAAGSVAAAQYLTNAYVPGDISLALASNGTDYSGEITDLFMRGPGPAVNRSPRTVSPTSIDPSSVDTHTSVYLRCDVDNDKYVVGTAISQLLWKLLNNRYCVADFCNNVDNIVPILELPISADEVGSTLDSEAAYVARVAFATAIDNIGADHTPSQFVSRLYFFYRYFAERELDSAPDGVWKDIHVLANATATDEAFCQHGLDLYYCPAP